MTQVVSVSRSWAREKLRQRFGTAEILDKLPIGVCCCDSEGYLLEFNRHAAELWGRRPEPGAERFGGAERLFNKNGVALPKEQAPLAEVLRTGGPVRNRLVIIEQPGGRRITVLFNAEPVRDEQGELRRRRELLPRCDRVQWRL